MRILFIVANLIQVAVVLVLFLSGGQFSDPLALTGLCLLMIIAFVNLVALIYYFPILPAGDENIRGKGPIKRRNIRVAYVLGPRPYLDTGKERFEIQDLSEQGIRVLAPAHRRLGRRVKGRIKLLCGQTIEIKGVVIRRQADEVAVFLNKPIAYPVVLAERKFVSRP